MPFLSTDLYMESEASCSIEQLSQRHGIRPEEVQDRIEARACSLTCSCCCRTFLFDLMLNQSV